MGQGKLGRGGTPQQHKKATPHSSPCQNEQQTTGEMDFLHIYDTRGTYQYSAGILVLTQKNIFFLLLLDVSTIPPRSGAVWGSPNYEICFFVVPSGSCWKIAAVFELGRCRGRRTSRQDRRSTHVNDASVPRCRDLLQPPPPPVCSWLSKASSM